MCKIKIAEYKYKSFTWYKIAKVLPNDFDLRPCGRSNVLSVQCVHVFVRND